MPSAPDAASAEKPVDAMTLCELAAEIERRLRILDRDPVNFPADGGCGRYFYCPEVGRAADRVLVRYRYGQTYHVLTGEQAGRYLQWLRAGNIGTHDDTRRIHEARPEVGHLPPATATIEEYHA